MLCTNIMAISTASGAKAANGVRRRAHSVSRDTCSASQARDALLRRSATAAATVTMTQNSASPNTRCLCSYHGTFSSECAEKRTSVP